MRCKTLKVNQHQRKKHFTAGNLCYVFDNGIILFRKELFVAESCTQVYQALKELIHTEGCEFVAGLPFAYDDACHLFKFATNPKRRTSTGQAVAMASWMESFARVDRYHYPNHTDAWCKVACCLVVCYVMAHGRPTWTRTSAIQGARKGVQTFLASAVCSKACGLKNARKHSSGLAATVLWPGT